MLSPGKGLFFNWSAATLKLETMVKETRFLLKTSETHFPLESLNSSGSLTKLVP